jgi:hypothetical protein
VVPGGRYFLLCFSDKQPGDWGPRRIRQDELQRCFALDGGSIPSRTLCWRSPWVPRAPALG